MFVSFFFYQSGVGHIHAFNAKKNSKTSQGDDDLLAELKQKKRRGIWWVTFAADWLITFTEWCNTNAANKLFLELSGCSS